MLTLMNSPVIVSLSGEKELFQTLEEELFSDTLRLFKPAVDNRAGFIRIVILFLESVEAEHLKVLYQNLKTDYGHLVGIFSLARDKTRVERELGGKHPEQIWVLPEQNVLMMRFHECH